MATFLRSSDFLSYVPTTCRGHGAIWRRINDGGGAPGMRVIDSCYMWNMWISTITMVIMVIMTMEYVEELVIDINYLMIIFHDKYDVHIMIIDG
jgi:hypothetical protein